LRTMVPIIGIGCHDLVAGMIPISTRFVSDNEKGFRLRIQRMFSRLGLIGTT